MAHLLESAKVLGIRKPLTSPLQFLDCIDEGLPAGSVKRIAATFAPGDAKFQYRIIPKATFARVRGRRRLNKAQSELVTRLAEVWVDAVRVWKTEDKARSFLNREHPLLRNNRPVDLVFQSAAGAQLVRDVLGRLEHGTAV